MSGAEAKWGQDVYEMRVNSLGMKDARQREVPLTSEKHRIVLLGDSFTEGIGMSYHDSFVGRFAKFLSDRAAGKVEVLNAGVVSYSPKLYYLTAKDLLDRVGLKIDEFIVFIDISDIYDELVYESYQSSPGTTWRDRYYQAKSFFNRNSYVYRTLLQGPVHQVLLSLRNHLSGQNKDTSPTIENTPRPTGQPRQPARSDWNNDEFADRARAHWTFDDKIYDRWGKYGVHLATKNLGRLISLSKEHGIKVSLAVYPWPEQIASETGPSRQEKIWSRFAQSHGLKLLNLFGDFKRAEAELFIKGDVHWNAEGHTLVAKKLIAFWCADANVLKCGN